MLRLLFLTLFCLTFLAGCSTAPVTYDDQHSRAWNIAHSVNMDELEDAEVARDQLPSAVWDGVDLGLETDLFMSDYGLDMDFGGALGMGLLMWLASPDDQTERATVLAWVPADDVADKDEAAAWHINAMRDATTAVFDDLGVEYSVSEKKRWLPPFDSYLETEIKGTLPDDGLCEARFTAFPSQIMDKTSMPDFIGGGTMGYPVNAGHDIQYPKAYFYCALGDGPTHHARLLSEVSKKLPPSLFIYSPFMEWNDEERLPPMILDHGKVLLFVTARKTD